MSSRFPIIEIFGPTIQGEGMIIGQKTMFVRTAGCDYRCAWCDSAYTWNGIGEIRLMTAVEIIAVLRSLAGNRYHHVTISGGNPALISALYELIDLLQQDGMFVALETQGSCWQNWFLKIDQLTLSPKPPSSGMGTNYKILDQIVGVLAEKQRNFNLKIVVFDEIDLNYAISIHKRYSHVPFYLQVGNENVTEQESSVMLSRLVERYKWLIEKVMVSTELVNVKVLPQLHTWLWGNKRGY